MSLYFNNAATTWPKPPCVADAMKDFLVSGGANCGRGSSSDRDLGTMGMVLECRSRLASFFGGYENGSPQYVTFTANITEALNVVLKGFLRPGMRVVTTAMEHNAVIRPLRTLENAGVEVCVAPCRPAGELEMEAFVRLLEEKRPDLAVVCHASNVCGTVQDLESIAAACRERGVPLAVDSAQTAGLLPLDAAALGLAALCFTGHKGLMGPQGTGGVVWRPEFASRCASLIEGGTGSFSHLETQPQAMPDKFESGTLNLPGIAGLNAALEWIEHRGVENLRRHENEIGARFLAGLKKLPGVIIYGLDQMTDKKRLPVFAVNFAGVDNGILAAVLSERGLETRPGLQCSPLAHKTLGSFPQGVLRLSPGAFTTPEEVDKALIIIDQSLSELRAAPPIRA